MGLSLYPALLALLRYRASQPLAERLRTHTSGNLVVLLSLRRDRRSEGNNRKTGRGLRACEQGSTQSTVYDVP